MFGSEVLDVAIGLVFVYLVLSLVCSAACELIESFLKRRGAYLERGLQELLDDGNSSGIVKDIYDHPLVSSLFQGKYQPGRRSNLPSYIPPANFALALMDIVGLCGPSPRGASLSVPMFPPGVTPPPDMIRATIIANLSLNPRVAQALLTLADAAKYDPERIRQNIEAWYSSAMDRVSGWFKRYSQFVVLGLGFVISLGINADTISITNTLATDKAVRESLISAATEASKSSTAGAPGDFHSDLEQIRSAGLPLGWVSLPSTDARRIPDTPFEWSLKLLGIVLTMFAISLGGPFWFDTLNRFMVVRSAVKPEKKEDAKG